MKKRTILSMTAALFIASSFGPAPHGAPAAKSGLYLTTDDFLKSRLSYATDVSSATEHKIKIHEGLFGSATVDLVYDGKKQVFSMDQVYGYRDAKGQDFRFFGRQTYRIEDTAGFYLYTCTKLVQGMKISRQQTLYYFSVKPGDNVEALTLANLESAYPGNPRFRYALEALTGHFRGDLELPAYDDALKAYKIKYLYAQSLQ